MVSYGILFHSSSKTLFSHIIWGLYINYFVVNVRYHLDIIFDIFIEKKRRKNFTMPIVTSHSTPWISIDTETSNPRTSSGLPNDGLIIEESDSLWAETHTVTSTATVEFTAERVRLSEIRVWKLQWLCESTVMSIISTVFYDNKQLDHSDSTIVVSLTVQSFLLRSLLSYA